MAAESICIASQLDFHGFSYFEIIKTVMKYFLKHNGAQISF